MKRHKPQETASRDKKHASMKALKKYIADEVTLIHKDLADLKSSLTRHSSMPDLQADDKNINDYYHSANDLFKQAALESDDEMPLEAKWYETFILRKNPKPSSACPRKSAKKPD